MMRMFATVAVAATLCCAPPAHASTYSDALAAVARQLDHAANIRTAVPSVHLPPAPVGGPPRYSPSVDDWLQAALHAAGREHNARRRTNDLRSIASSLRYLAAEGAASAQASGPRDDPKTAAANILAQPAYRAAQTTPAPPPKESIWERILAWIVNELAKLFGGIAQAAQGAPLLGEIFAIALITLAVLGLAYVAYRIADGYVLRRRTDIVEGDLLPARSSANELYASARDAASDGRYARAVTLLFLSTLILLDRTQRVQFDAARTAGEYRRVVRRNVQWITGDFDALARAFTLALYAGAPIGEPEWSLAERSYLTLAPALGAQ